MFHFGLSLCGDFDLKTKSPESKNDNEFGVKTMNRVYSAALLLVFLTGCAGTTTMPTGVSGVAVEAEKRIQAGLVVKAYKSDAERLYRLAYPIYQAAAEICRADKVGPSIGLVGVSSVDTVPRDYKDAAQAELGLAQGVSITFLPSASAAAKSGLQVGDQIIGVGTMPIPIGRTGLIAFNRAVQTLDSSLGMVDVAVVRNGAQQVIPVELERLPRISLNYDPFSPMVNAFADGTSVNFTRGLLRAMSSDASVSMVVAHELAHNCQGHIEAKRTNAMGGLLLDILAASAGVNTQGAFSNAAASAYSMDFEREADYVGLYYLARAGLSVSEARDAYRLLTVETGAALTAGYGATHPANPERFVRMEETEKEIETKKSAGEVLIPQQLNRAK
jgi:Zn-dependent protease with chaperone function